MDNLCGEGVLGKFCPILGPPGWLAIAIFAQTWNDVTFVDGLLL